MKRGNRILDIEGRIRRENVLDDDTPEILGNWDCSLDPEEQQIVRSGNLARYRTVAPATDIYLREKEREKEGGDSGANSSTGRSLRGSISCLQTFSIFARCVSTTSRNLEPDQSAHEYDFVRFRTNANNLREIPIHRAERDNSRIIYFSIASRLVCDMMIFAKAWISLALHRLRSLGPETITNS